ncbi:MAG: uroporphyrinogen-III C-methyltransferase [Anaerovoracaceae bacterium]
MTNMNRGKVWLVGAGPSDVGLFTLKGKQVLENADVVVYDKLVGQGVLGMIPQNAQKIFVGKVAGNHAVPQEKINEILLVEAQKGKKVVRLKGGDPFVFGRGGEELELLCENDIPFEIVPGITSAVAVPAYNGIPVTHRDFTSSFHVITGHTKYEEAPNIDFESLVKLNGTLIFLMGVSSLPKICEGLINAGMDKDMPAAVLERGTRAHQRRVVSDITNLPKDAVREGVKTPAIIIVGKVCSLADDFAWAEKRPLGGLKIAVTRPQDRSSKLGEKLAMLGGEVVMLPAIETIPIADNIELAEAITSIKEYGWIGFTSPIGPKIFFDKLREMKIDIRKLGDIKFAAIGSGTKKVIENQGIMVDLVPEVFNGEELGKELAKNCKGQRVLIPRAEIGTPEVVKPLVEAGISYNDIPIYKTKDVMEEQVNSYDESIDITMFTSASTVHAFVKNNRDVDYSSVKALCIGEQTAAVAREHNMQVIVSAKATIDSMITKLLEEFKR